MNNINKSKNLKKFGCINPSPEKVKDICFNSNSFFDPEDLMQVKYEMIRKVKTNESNVTQACRDFGFSRVSFYKILKIFDEFGISGFIPKTTGPTKGHKLTPEIHDYIKDIISKPMKISAKEISRIIKDVYSVELSIRTINRCITKIKKKL